MWAKSSTKGRGGVVTRYRFYEDEALSECSFIDFGEENDEYHAWLETITRCRLYGEKEDQYQIMYGPISDDNGFALLIGYVDYEEVERFVIHTNYMDAISSPDELLVELLGNSPGEQVVFKDNASLKYLEYDGVEE